MIYQRFFYCLFLSFSAFLLLYPQYAKSSALPVEAPFDRNSEIKVDLSDGVITGASVKKGTAANDSYNAANDEYIKTGSVKVTYNNYTKTESGKTVLSDKGSFSLGSKVVAANAFANLASALSQLVSNPAVIEAASAAVESASAGDAAAAAAHAGGAAATAAASMLFPSSVSNIASNSVESTSKELWEERKKKEEEKEGVDFIWGYVKLLPDGSYSERIYVFAKYGGNTAQLSTIASGKQVGFENSYTGWRSMVDNSDGKISGVGVVAMGRKQVEDFFKNNPQLFKEKDVKEELMKSIDKTLKDMSSDMSEVKKILADSVASGSIPSSTTLSEPVTAPLSDGASVSATPLSANKVSLGSVPSSKASAETKASSAKEATLEGEAGSEKPQEAGGFKICEALPILCDTEVEKEIPLDVKEAEQKNFDVGVSVACPANFDYRVNIFYFSLDVNIPVGDYCEKTKMIKPLVLFLAFLIAVRIYSKWVN